MKDKCSLMNASENNPNMNSVNSHRSFTGPSEDRSYQTMISSRQAGPQTWVIVTAVLFSVSRNNWHIIMEDPNSRKSHSVQTEEPPWIDPGTWILFDARLNSFKPWHDLLPLNTSDPWNKKSIRILYCFFQVYQDPVTSGTVLQHSPRSPNTPYASWNWTSPETRGTISLMTTFRSPSRSRYNQKSTQSHHFTTVHYLVAGEVSGPRSKTTARLLCSIRPSQSSSP